ncbi:MAG: hypothetical protein H5U02_08075 [Clostridia bacterium]|nr:hypothetical protein [Clostridia bacterium]
MPKDPETRLMILVMAEAQPTNSAGSPAMEAVWAGMVAKAMARLRMTNQVAMTRHDHAAV